MLFRVCYGQVFCSFLRQNQKPTSLALWILRGFATECEADGILSGLFIYTHPPPFKEILPYGKMGALSQVSYYNNTFFIRWSNDHRPPGFAFRRRYIKVWRVGLDKFLFRLSFGCFLFCSFFHFFCLLCKLFRFLSGPLRCGGVKLLLHVYVGGVYPKAVSVRHRVRGGTLG